jgi:acetyltransferase EpsM
MKKLIIIGGRGNGTVVASTVEDINKINPVWEIIGFLNDFDTGDINGYPILGDISKESVDKYRDDENVFFFYSLISVKLNHKFIHKLHDLNLPVERFATIIHPTAVVSKFAEIGYGVAIQPLVNISPNVKIGNHIHVFAQAMIGHDAVLRDYSYVANNACIGGHTTLEEGAYIGTNATTIEKIKIGKWSIVGMGTVVIRNVEDYNIVVGNPSRVIGSTK